MYDGYARLIDDCSPTRGPCFAGSGICIGRKRVGRTRSRDSERTSGDDRRYGIGPEMPPTR